LAHDVSGVPVIRHLCLSLLVLSAPVALAQQEEPRDALVREVTGTVNADIGQGLRPALVKELLPPQSRVVVEPASSTILSFGKDCDIKLQPGDWRVPNPSAATVAEIKGGVLLFQNEEFVPVTPNQPVKVKDRILVQAESSAVLRYETGCDLKLDPGITEVPDGCRCLGALYADGRRAGWLWTGGLLVLGAAIWDNDERRAPASP
jgi:hypothetical protein